MHSRASGLHAVLLAAVSLVALTGCPDAAPAPCLIQRPFLQGYTIKFILEGAHPPAARTCPSTFADNWRFDGFDAHQIWVKSDSIPYPPGDEGDRTAPSSETARSTRSPTPTTSAPSPR